MKEINPSEGKLTHASLFSGIGGFDLAARWAGFENKFWCEIEPFAQRVLRYHLKNSIGYENIRTTDFSIWRGRVDVLSGGFPCQPFSVAGSRKGKEDDRYLWDEMLRAISEIRPSWVVGENVAGILSMVQPSEEARMAREKYKSGASDYSEEREEYVLASIIRDLNGIGYDVQPFVIPACAVGAPHKRDRLWIVANSIDSGIKGEQGRQELSDGLGSTADTDSVGQQRWSCKAERQIRQAKQTAISDVSKGWKSFPSKSPICGGDDGLPRELDSITFPKWSRGSVKAYGNAIVPQVAFEIFKAIKLIQN